MCERKDLIRRQRLASTRGSQGHEVSSNSSFLSPTHVSRYQHWGRRQNKFRGFDFGNFPLIWAEFYASLGFRKGDTPMTTTVPRRLICAPTVYGHCDHHSCLDQGHKWNSALDRFISIMANSKSIASVGHRLIHESYQSSCFGGGPSPISRKTKERKSSQQPCP